MRTTGIAAALCLSLISLTLANESHASIRKTTNIPAQGLVAALNMLAQERDLQVVYRTEVVGARQTRGAVGELTADEAFKRLLDDTGLTYKYIDEATVMIEPARAPRAGADKGRKNGVEQTPVTEEKADVDSQKSPLWRWLRLSQAASVSSTEAEPRQPPDVNGTGGEIGEVVVTAQKREQRIQDVPMSISAITPEEISQRGLVGAEDYLRGLPGVNQSESGTAGQIITIRGVGTDNSFLNLGAGSTVSTYFGETPTTTAGGMFGSSVDLKLVDIARVEVLRGPQGTSFGAASLTGAVRIIPNAPDTDRVEASFGTGFSKTSSFGGDNYHFQGMVNVPLIRDVLAVRAVGYRFAQTGYYRSVAGSDPTFQSEVERYGLQRLAFDEEHTGGQTVNGLRASALITPSSNLNITLSYLNHTDLFEGTPDSTVGDRKFDRVGLLVAPEHVFRGHKSEVQYKRVQIGNAVVDYDLGWANVLGTFSRVSSDLLFQSAPYAGFPVSDNGPADHREYSGELRIATRLGGAWDFLGGVFAEHQEDDGTLEWLYLGADAAANPFSDRQIFFQTFSRDLKQKAAFGEASWKFAPGFTLTAGGRAYQYDRSILDIGTGPLLGGSEPRTDADVSASGTNYKANLSYQPNPQTLVYAGWSQGFRLGRAQAPLPSAICDMNGDGLVDGTSIGIASTGEVKSDSVDNFELGTKWQLANRALSVNAALFRMTWAEIPITIYPDFTTACIANFVTNGGEARSDGVELQGTWLMGEHFDLGFGGSYVHARLTQDSPSQGWRAGDRLPGAPQVTGNLALTWRHNFNDLPASIRADATYVGSFETAINEPATESGDYVRLDLSGRLEVGSLNLTLFMRNLTNEDAWTYRSGTLGSVVMRPRTAGFEIDYRF